jgi:hypothetical protein
VQPCWLEANPKQYGWVKDFTEKMKEKKEVQDSFDEKYRTRTLLCAPL